MFEQYAAILQQKYPYLTIEAENYPPPMWKQKVAQFLVTLKLSLFFVCFLPGNIQAHLLTKFFSGSIENSAHSSCGVRNKCI